MISKPPHRRPIRTSADQVREIKLEEWERARKILDEAKVNSVAVWDPDKKEWVLVRDQ